MVARAHAAAKVDRVICGGQTGADRVGLGGAAAWRPDWRMGAERPAKRHDLAFLRIGHRDEVAGSRSPVSGGRAMVLRWIGHRASHPRTALSGTAPAQGEPR